MAFPSERIIQNRGIHAIDEQMRDVPASRDNRPMKNILIANNKGGVGKTTIASQLVYAMADERIVAGVAI